MSSHGYLANGSVGYIPTNEAYDKTQSALEPVVGEIMANKVITFIENLRR